MIQGVYRVLGSNIIIGLNRLFLTGISRNE